MSHLAWRSAPKSRMATPNENPQMEQHGVRFAAENQEIAPEVDLHTTETLTGHDGRREDLNPEAEQELQQLKTTLRNNIQSARMQHHNFEPVSLPGSAPASRVSIHRRPRRLVAF